MAIARDGRKRGAKRFVKNADQRAGEGRAGSASRGRRGAAIAAMLRSFKKTVESVSDKYFVAIQGGPERYGEKEQASKAQEKMVVAGAACRCVQTIRPIAVDVC
jgi:hypothetical protein